MKPILQDGPHQAIQERPLPKSPVPPPDADQPNSGGVKKKRGRRKAEATAEKPRAAASKPRARKVTQKVPEESERLVIGRFKDALAKQKTADEANEVHKPP